MTTITAVSYTHLDVYKRQVTYSGSIALAVFDKVIDECIGLFGRTAVDQRHICLLYTSYLTEQVFKRPVFVTDYPKDIKAFYMKMNDDNKTVAAVDCLVPGIGEIIGGSQREDDYEKLAARMEELGMKTEDYQFYMDLRKYGSTRHAGFGLGFERCIMYLTGMSNIRDVIPFPRTVNNCEL